MLPVYRLAILLPLIAIVPLFTGALMPDTADGIFHTHRLYAMTRLMLDGNLYPRWVPWFHLGYGYPVFNYYAPLATWVGGVLGVLGIGAPLAFQLITATSWIAGSVGMTALARRFLPDAAALVAAALWVYAPVRMHEYWIQGSLPHIAATALAPWVFLTLTKLVSYPKRRTALQFGMAVGLLILAHQPTTYLMGLYAGVAGVSLLLWRTYRQPGDLLRILKAGGMGLLVALGLAAVLLLPMLFEVDAIVINNTPSGNIPALLANNAIPLSELFTQPGPLDHTDLSATIPHTYGLLSGVLAIVGLMALIWNRLYALALLLAVGVMVSVFLATPASLDVWHRLPLMDQLRFPWRVMRIGIVPLSLLAAASLRVASDRWMGHVSVGIIALAIFAAMPTLYPIDRMVDFAGQTAADMIRYEWDRGAIGGTSYNEFKPNWGKRTPRDLPDNMADYEIEPLRLQVTEAINAQLERISPACWVVTASNGAYVDFRQFYFPGWQATLNGDALPLEIESTYGLLRVPLPQTTDATLCLTYAGTDLQRLAGWLTIVTGGIVIGMWMTSRKHVATASAAPAVLSSRWALRVGVALILVAILNGLWIGPHTNWFRLQSPADDPLGMEVPVQVEFAQGYRLLGYTLHKTAISAGEPLSLTLYWLPLSETDGLDYYPVVQLVNLPGTKAWASVELPFVGTTPYNHTPQRFISQLVNLTLFDDAPPFVGLVDVRLVDWETGDWVSVANDAGNRVLLPDVIPITSETPAVINADSGYLIGEAIALVDAGIQHDYQTLVVDLTWQTHQSLPLDNVTFFIHALDSAGNVVQQIDEPPFSGDYPARYWRADQTLSETYRLPIPVDETVTRLALGMYTPGNRLPVTLAGQPVQDGLIILDVP